MATSKRGRDADDVGVVMAPPPKKAIASVEIEGKPHTVRRIDSTSFDEGIYDENNLCKASVRCKDMKLAAVYASTPYVCPVLNYYNIQNTEAIMALVLSAAASPKTTFVINFMPEGCSERFVNDANFNFTDNGVNKSIGYGYSAPGWPIPNGMDGKTYKHGYSLSTGTAIQTVSRHCYFSSDFVHSVMDVQNMPKFVHEIAAGAAQDIITPTSLRQNSKSKINVEMVRSHVAGLCRRHIAVC